MKVFEEFTIISKSLLVSVRFRALEADRLGRLAGLRHLDRQRRDSLINVVKFFLTGTGI